MRRDTRLPLGLLAAGLAMWAGAVPGIDLAAMDDTGLVSALPLLAVAGLVALNVGFCLALRRSPVPSRLLAAYAVALVVMLYGITSVVGEAPRGSVVWRHAGIIDNLVRTGQPDPTIDAYFNWPGLFMFGASVSELAGFASPMAFARWAPVYFNLLYLAPLAMILRSATDDARLVWLGVWLFCLTNWINQDYFAPQSATYFLFLVVVAVVLRWFGPEPAPAGARQRGVLMGVVLIVVAASVPTHQLTPFAMLAAVTALVAIRRCRATGLPVVIAVLIASWLGFMTLAYLRGHLPELVGRIGDVGGTASANVGDRLQGSPGHLLVVRTRLLLTGGVGALALLGALRHLDRRQRLWPMAALAVAPLPLLLLQPYGGEMIMRVYLFSLPFLVFFAAAVFYSGPRSVISWRGTAAMASVCTLLLGGFLVSRYGNERMDQYTAAELAAVDRLYQLAPAGSLLVAGAGNLPWKYRDYERYDYLTLTSLWEKDPRLEDVVHRAAGAMAAGSSYLIFTRSQQAYTDLLGVMPTGTLRRIEDAVAASPQFALVHRSADASIFATAPALPMVVAAGAGS
ncbi:MAG TPA: hypothetical protein VNT56_06940 [Acidimicrobiales bacterium]|nr:hypothetical protein [Acidimicrobiales bacterium]